ncbi:hypothetical protein UFOVP585_18 [uncultured Caudovirales phage]|uniref:Uncharacterized protein n=1 Tax=uncultured Caudovirales phage TaxID=2100421 RepID=A0A6J5N6V4_9CAUD|nr:hypothetical protein UFOVP585_18 [uncultured Caudovirales phage]
MKIKTVEELKREYWSRPEMCFTPKMVDAIVREYKDKPATSGEAFYIANHRLCELLSRGKDEMVKLLEKLLKERSSKK